MRLFFAVELAPAVRAAAHAAGRRLAADLEAPGAAGATGIDARWIPEDNLHITLWFLGELGDDRMGPLEGAMSHPFGVPPFDMRVGGFGIFPPSGPPRVIWIGVSAGAEGLRALHAELATRLRPLGFEPERRPYSPHLTLARLRVRPAREASQAARRAIAARPVAVGVSPVDAVTLFRSRPSPRGAAYESLLRVPLKG